MISQKPMWQNWTYLLLKQPFNQPAAFVEITKFPTVSRDIALLLKQKWAHQEVVDAIQAAGVKRLTAIKLLEGSSQVKNWDLAWGHMAYSPDLQNPEDNLTDEEVARYNGKIRNFTRRKRSKRRSALRCKKMKQLRISQLFFLPGFASYRP